MLNNTSGRQRTQGIHSSDEAGFVNSHIYAIYFKRSFASWSYSKCSKDMQAIFRQKTCTCMCMPVHVKHMKCFEDNCVMPWKVCEYKHKIYACSFIDIYLWVTRWWCFCFLCGEKQLIKAM